MWSFTTFRPYIQAPDTIRQFRFSPKYHHHIKALPLCGTVHTWSLTFTQVRPICYLSLPMEDAMSTFNFTTQGLKGLATPPKPKQIDYHDTKVSGFGLRVGYGGKRTFYCVYRNASKRLQRVSLGNLEHTTLADARKAARRILAKVDRGIDPAADARALKALPIVSDLASDYISMQRKRIKTAEQQMGILDRDVLPAIGNMKAIDVRRADIRKIMDTITARDAKYGSNRAHEVMRHLFNYGIEEEIYGLENNPAARLGKHRNRETRRDRWLDLPELGSYWNALDAEDPNAAAALRLCLLTGQRQGNVLGMRVGQIRDDLWIIPASETKTNREYRVPLSGAALDIIKSLDASDWMFKGGPRDLIGTVHAAVCKRLGIEGYTVRDARHTFAENMDRLGVPRHIWSGIMGHKQGGIGDVYSGYGHDDERRDAVEKWADKIMQIVA